MAQRTVRIENGVTTQLSNTHIEQVSLSRFYTERGAKRYELTNHLGNVLTVVTDKKLPICSGTSVSYFIADVVSATDYSPFGAPLAERTWQGGEYKFGFNGKEKDNETYGDGNAYDFGARVYDGRLGRFLSADKFEKMAPHWTPYRFGFNNPIRVVDKDGNYEEDGHYWTVLMVATLLRKPNAKEIAFWAEAPDHIMSKNGKILFPTSTWIFPPFQIIFHALTGGNSENERSISSLLVKLLLGNVLKGLFSHRLGDSHSHEMKNSGKMYPPILGHGLVEPDPHAPDYIKSDSEKYLSYVNSITASLGGTGSQIDMTVFNYVANVGLDTKANVEILKSEFNLQTGSNSFEIANNQIGNVGDYLISRASEMKFTYSIESKKNFWGRTKTTVTINRTENE